MSNQIHLYSTNLQRVTMFSAFSLYLFLTSCFICWRCLQFSVQMSEEMPLESQLENTFEMAMPICGNEGGNNNDNRYVDENEREVVFKNEIDDDNDNDNEMGGDSEFEEAMDSGGSDGEDEAKDEQNGGNQGSFDDVYADPDRSDYQRPDYMDRLVPILVCQGKFEGSLTFWMGQYHLNRTSDLKDRTVVLKCVEKGIFFLYFFLRC